MKTVIKNSKTKWVVFYHDNVYNQRFSYHDTFRGACISRGYKERDLRRRGLAGFVKMTNGAYEVCSVEEYDRKFLLHKVVKNLMTGKNVVLESDTPRCCDPSSELYWSM